jgi:hypothetical protein
MPCAARANELDTIVFRAMMECLVSRHGRLPDQPEWASYGFPHFHGHRRIRQTNADRLCKQGITAPRGGIWSVRQVHRALLRYADHLERLRES